MPSAIFLRTFFLTRCAALLEGDFAISYPWKLFLQRLSSFARPFSRARIGTRALPTQRKTSTMTETTITTDIHQPLNVHCGFATQIPLNNKLGNLLTNLFKIGIRQFLDLFRIHDTTCITNFTSTGSTNAIDSGQTNFHMLMWGNINASNTCHFSPLKSINLDVACDADPSKSHAPHFCDELLYNYGRSFLPTQKLSYQSP